MKKTPLNIATSVILTLLIAVGAFGAWQISASSNKYEGLGGMFLLAFAILGFLLTLIVRLVIGFLMRKRTAQRDETASAD